MAKSWLPFLCLVLASVTTVRGEDAAFRGPLHRSAERLSAIIPYQTRRLVEPGSIEQWLKELDGSPPDWPAVYGGGHHDPGQTSDFLRSTGSEMQGGMETPRFHRW
jgi:hypothetical protein